MKGNPMKNLRMKFTQAWRLGALLALGALPLGCATTGGGVPVPDSTTVSRADSQWPGTTLADLQRGRTAYVQNCAACHDLHEASEFSPDEWKSVMVKMRKKAHLDDITNDAILHYLLASTTKQD
jgi:mono/diheme cytochrome c family protein